MTKLRNLLGNVDRLSNNAATAIAVGCEISIALTIAAILTVNKNYFAALEMASLGIKLLSATATVSLIWDLSTNRTGDKNDAT